MKREARLKAAAIAIIKDMQKKDKTYIPAMGFDFLTPFYDTLMKVALHEDALKNALLEEAHIRPGQKVLDFGCGTATLAIMAKLKHPEATIVGLDVDENVLSIAKKKIAKQGVDIRIDIYDGFNLPYEAESFDSVISSFVFHHLSTEQKKDIMKQIYLILKPGGSVYILDFGVPASMLAKGVMYIFSLFESMDDNVRGLIPEYMINAGFVDMRKVRDFKELWGTFSLHSGLKGGFILAI